MAERKSERIGANASPPDRNRRAAVGPGWFGAWGAIISLSLWLSHLAPIWLGLICLGVAAVGSAAWTVSVARSPDPLRGFAAVLLWLTVGIAGGAHLRLSEIANDWPGLQVEVEERAAEALGAALDALLDEGERAVAGAAAAAEPSLSSGAPFAALSEVQRTTGVSAIAIFDRNGEALAWAGEHRGNVPPDARFGMQSYIFHEGPLFSYLYFVRPISNGMTAAAAFLLEASIESGEGGEPFAESFQREHGPRPRFWIPERAPSDAVWDWGVWRGRTDGPEVDDDGRRILSVSFVELSQQDWWERVAGNGQRAVAIALVGALLVLSAAWYRARMQAAGVPVLVAVAALLAAPLADLVGAQPIFSPLQFVLPGPADVTLGVLLILLIGGAIWLLTRAPADRVGKLPVWLAALLLALIFPLALHLVSRSAADGLVAARTAGGFALQIATVFLMSVPAFLVLRSMRRPRVRRDRTLLLAVAGVVLPAALGLGMLAWWQPDRPIPFALAALWAVPALCLALADSRFHRPSRMLRQWLTAGWVASTAALTFLWPMHVRAELGRAAREISLLGTHADPFLDFLLRQFAENATGFAGEGETGVNLLYHSWVASGLAREGYEARMSLWRNGEVEAELNLSELEALPRRAVSDVQADHAGPAVVHYMGIEGLHYLLVVPIDGERVVSVAVPPRRRLATATPLARFLHPEGGPTPVQRSETLTLVPVDTSALMSVHAPVGGDTVQWVRTESGWRSETLVEMPEGMVHAHMLVAVPQVTLLLTRAVLVIVLILATLFAAWLIARLICHDLAGIRALRIGPPRSFRGRLSLALFVFFLLPTLVFGAVSYGAVAREVLRSAAALAQQALDQADALMPEATLADLGGAVPTDLLLYQRGTLAGATAPEILELGLFDTWLPPDVYLRFTGGIDLQELQERQLAESEYLVAYRRLGDDSVLAAPIPLESDEIQRRQREFRDVALLVILLGLALSMVLARLVSRALARPLDELSRAAVTVGRGDLRTQLPETRSDEFGSVYASFNRMVTRLRRTRAALVRETRRTETIVAEAATGVLALDSAGRVELINPRAAEVLGGEISTGDLLIASDPSQTGIGAAISALLASGSPEAGTEVEVDGRIVRLRLRRLSGGDGAGGAVVALEDVTAEVRTARVLAWGEMARQVAHEIKNPLTPIKLAVQHLQRAFVDRRPDYGEILDRNVEAILREIDRLGDISRAFSRFGTPSADSPELEEVDVGRAVHEVLALYQGSTNGVVIRADLGDSDLPRVVARTGELKEVLLNLLENAREAVGTDGEVVISATPPDETGSLLLTVADTGIGIPEQELPKIFEPHFSTRSSGTGLGLAIVRRIVDSWGGSIRAESEVGVGTRVEIRLRTVGDPAVSDLASS